MGEDRGPTTPTQTTHTRAFGARVRRQIIIELIKILVSGGDPSGVEGGAGGATPTPIHCVRLRGGGAAGRRLLPRASAFEWGGRG